MILIGQYDSPFVRRVAVTMHVYGLAFESQALSVFADFDRVSAVHPLGQVPALVLDDGEVLVDSAAILDALDEASDPALRLMPPSGGARRRAMRCTAMGLGVATKAVALSAERRRHAKGTFDEDWAGRLAGQIGRALTWLEAQMPDPFLAGSRLTQADVTAACAVTYVARRHPDLLAVGSHPALRRLTAACEAHPAFRAAPFPEDGQPPSGRT